MRRVGPARLLDTFPSRPWVPQVPASREGGVLPRIRSALGIEWARDPAGRLYFLDRITNENFSNFEHCDNQELFKILLSTVERIATSRRRITYKVDTVKFMPNAV